MPKIMVQQAVDEHVYHAPDVKYESETVDDTRIVFVVFTPTNGYERGKVHHVPISRVIAVIEDA